MSVNLQDISLYPVENYRFHWDSSPCIQDYRAPGKFSGVLRVLIFLEFFFLIEEGFSSSSSNDILPSFSLASQLFIVTTATPVSFETEVTLRFDGGRIFFNTEFLKLVVYFFCHLTRRQLYWHRGDNTARFHQSLDYNVPDEMYKCLSQKSSMDVGYNLA